MKSELIQIIKEFLIKKLNPEFIIVFGSYAKGYTHPNSDVDFAFYNKDIQLTSYDYFLIAQDVANILKIEVDLVNLRTASPVFRSQILYI
ncbi:nucleotidyltransferase domain-containing protein [Neobacillus drentensis]|uniref:type VII toxin-antitoxin system MntA family adenylyltransferase antitoxin n=1 Tax=Neobacillus drentensis TaxID=220684 RepID=UPI002FFE2858